MSNEHDENKLAMDAALRQWSGKHDSGTAARRKRLKQSRRRQDGRSLKETGRSKLFNFMIKPELLEQLYEHVGRGKLSVWLEKAIEKARAEGMQVDE